MRALRYKIFLNYTMLLEERQITERVARSTRVAGIKKNSKIVLLFF